MTQKRWWTLACVLALAFGANTAWSQEKTDTRSGECITGSPKECDQDCPVLSKIPYINRLFKNPASTCRATKARCGNAVKVAVQGITCQAECCPGECVDRYTCETPCSSCPDSGCPCCKECCPKAARSVASPRRVKKIHKVVITPVVVEAIAPVAVGLPPLGLFHCAPLSPVTAVPAWTAPPPCPVPCFAPQANAKQYTVDLKLVEAVPGEQDQVKLSPKLAVVQGQEAHIQVQRGSGKVCTPNGICTEAPVGYALKVKVLPREQDTVRLEVSLEKQEQDKTQKGLAIVRKKVQVVQMVKLGKTSKVSLESKAGKKGTKKSWLEVTVNEVKREKKDAVWHRDRTRATRSVADMCAAGMGCGMYEIPWPPAPVVACPPCLPAPAPRMPTCTAPVPSPFATQPMPAPRDCKPSFTGVARASWATSTPVDSPSSSMKVSLEGSRVKVLGFCWKAMADKVTTDQKGTIDLCGNVHLQCGKDGEIAEISAEKVTLQVRDGKVQVITTIGSKDR